ncbi:MAG TPA: hypothetical protein VJ946_14515, partial [Bacteroidales bacterium]|nr:hypothetical protein [Bacteroidales bacterium]
MKKILLTLLLIFLAMLNLVTAQNQNVAINNTGNLPHASAMLDVSSTEKGMLIPRMSTAERNAISSPAEALLVYDTTEDAFYYYDGSNWTEIGGGGSAGGCVTLNEAYNCGGDGLGKDISANYGAVSITAGTSASNSNALEISSENGSSSTPGSGISITNSAHGVALYGETTGSDNLYGSIQGVVGTQNNNSNPDQYPAGVSGYYDGSGTGVGLWGQTQGNSGGAGVYGLASNNNFGGYFESSAYPGVYCVTGSASAQALQVSSAGGSYTNPGAMIRGYSQFDISTNGACHSVLMNNLASEPTISPQANQYGYIGTNNYAWYYLYYLNAVQVSRRETKRDITYLDKHLGKYVMQDIEQMKPAFYKYKVETDKFDPDNPRKYRPNMHMGIILDEAPDYLQDNAFSGIDIYALSTLTLAGVQENRKDIKEITKKVSDFGMVNPESQEMWIEFDDSFSGKLNLNAKPVVTATPNQQGVSVSVKDQTRNGFMLVTDKPDAQNLMINWVAMAKTKVNETQPAVDPALERQLDVPETVKT